MSKSDSAVGQVSLEELDRRIKEAGQLLDRIESLLPGLVTLTDEARRTSDGRFRNGEANALTAVLDVADHAPAAFNVLADKDGGKDPKKFETNFLRDGLQRASALDQLATDLEDLARNVRDTQLELASKPKRVALSAYEIAKVLAKHDDVIRTKLAPLIDFYAAPARQAAKTRAQRKADPGGRTPAA